MQTSATVSSVRALYEYLTSNASAFVGSLNEVLYRLSGYDLWEGFTENVLFAPSTEGYLVLPRQFISVLGFQTCSSPKPIFGQFHEYQQQGYGWHDVSEMCMSGLIATDNVCAQKDISGTATLRVKISNVADAAKVIRFYGLDQNDEKIYTVATGVEGIALTTANPSADTTQQFKALSGIQAPSNMLGRWTLWQVVAGVETQIGSYEPGESVPNYRRYKIGVRTTNDVVRCFCQRGFVQVAAETDWVFPGCLSAIKHGFKALRYENAGNDDAADKAWARAENELNKELQGLRGSEVQMLRIIGMPRSTCGYVN